jgi:hypothetical protein
MFCGNVAKATKNKKTKEGRHVGLDFYDLLIEALKTTVPFSGCKDRTGNRIAQWWG